MAAAFLEPEGEKAIHEIVLAAIKEGGEGTLAHLRGRRPVELTPEQALSLVRERNLSIQAAQQDQEIAEDLLVLSRSIFDPVLNLSGTYSRRRSYERSEFITRDRENFSGTLIVPGGALSSDLSNELVCITVDGLIVSAEQCGSLSTQRTPDANPLTPGIIDPEFASFDSDAAEAWQIDFGALKRFPWGSLLQVQFQSTKTPRNALGTPVDPFGLDLLLSPTDLPWTSSFFALFTSPLPFSRNFGPYGSFANIQVLLAKIGERQADWAVESNINAVLRDVDDAYWELVRSIKLLQIIGEQQQVLEDLVKRAQSLFEAQSITVYDKVQIEADLENIKNQAEIAWNSLITSSNRLVDLLDYESDQLILPVGYSQLLKQSVEEFDPDNLNRLDPDQAIATALGQHPDIKLSQFALESSEILLKHRRAQTYPDFNLEASINLGQSNAILGYETWEDSFANVFDPDTSEFFVGVSFRVPLGNRAVRSALSQARLGYSQAQDQVQQTENSVIQDVNSVIATGYSTQASILQFQAGLELAQFAYNKAGQFREQILVTEFEFLRKLNDLLTARSNLINTLIDHRKTRAQILAAQGILARGY
jgi:outer membrane protein TolC